MSPSTSAYIPSRTRLVSYAHGFSSYARDFPIYGAALLGLPAPPPPHGIPPPPLWCPVVWVPPLPFPPMAAVGFHGYCWLGVRLLRVWPEDVIQFH